MVLQPKQTVQQRLMLAPNVTLALEVLRMPTMELQTLLRQQAEENPLLEVDDAEEEEGEPSLGESDGREGPVGEGLDEEWLSQWQREAVGEESSEEEEGLTRLLEQRLATPESFHDSLLLQLGCQQLSEEERRLGEALIQRLDEYGYLEGPPEELAAELGASLNQVEAVLRLIQHLDPPGVGARDLRECLMLQVERNGSCGSLAYRILRDHFKLFVQHHLSALARTTGSSLAQVEEACASLKQLNPKPGRIFSGELPPSVVPDLVIVRRETHDDVELNDQEMPHVTVSRVYYRMLKNPNTPHDAREFLANKFRQAMWLIKAIEERNATVLAIGRCLISLQREFVAHGPRALKPLTQAQVAALVGRHASTVSRAIAGKTIDTPYGIFRLEQLFPTGVPQTLESTDVSDATIKAEIQRLIAEEDARHPFSDEALARRLGQCHISVARRTVAKYRASLKILPTHLRKRRL